MSLFRSCRLRHLLIPLVCLLFATNTLAANDSTTEPAPHTGKPYVDMNYGPNLNMTLEAGDGNFAYKGIAIRLDEGPHGVTQGDEFVVFDTDTLRYAAGWVGEGFINWRGIQFNGNHGVHPRPVGTAVFENNPGPGWARPGTADFTDERLVGRDGKHYGPVARDWARWKGHYHHAQQVILAYQVGSADILELPSPLPGNNRHGFVRSLEIGPRETDLVVQVAEVPNSEIAIHEPNNSRSTGFVIASHLEPARVAPNASDSSPESEEPNTVLRQRDGKGLLFDGQIAGIVAEGTAFEMSDEDFSIWASVETENGGTIFARAPREGRWEPGGKALFVSGGRLVYDVGWVGAVASRGHKPINDGKSHRVGMVFARESKTVRLFLDGKLVAEEVLETGEPAEDHVVKLGFASPNFPDGQSAFDGVIHDVRFYAQALLNEQMAGEKGPSKSPLAHWNRSHDGRFIDKAGRHHAKIVVAETVVDDEEESEATSPLAASQELGNSLGLGLARAPAGCEWITEDDHVRLRIPAGQETIRLQIVYQRIASDSAAAVFAATLQEVPAATDLQQLTTGGPRKWKESISTEVALYGPDNGPFVAESLTLPQENPYRSWMRLGGFDFFPEGNRAAVCTWQGDVWIVEGVGEAVHPGSELTWTRIASGMFQPLGLKIVDGDIYVTCRDQITILRDLNGDGETDYYENFNNDHQVTDHFHEFAVDLQTDAEGNFYYAKCARHALDALVPQHGTLLKVSKDGSQTEIIARGYRAPNGVCVNDDGTFFLSDQEGHWTPKNRINWVRPGGFYGNMMAYHEGRKADDFEPPVCWIHNDYDRSPAQQVWVTSKQWGPLEGQLLSLSYGTGEIHLVLRDIVDGVMQGGVIRLPVVDFPTGTMRGRFYPGDGHPGDGQLYTCGLFGWSSNKTSPGGFYRVRYTNKPLHLPVELRATSKGIELKFTESLDDQSVTNYRNWSVERWQYRRTKNYGSEDYRVTDSRRRGRERMRVESVHLGEDKRSVFVELRDMQPVMQLELQYQIKAGDGTPISQRIHSTVHQLAQPATAFAASQP